MKEELNLKEEIKVINNIAFYKDIHWIIINESVKEKKKWKKKV